MQGNRPLFRVLALGLGSVAVGGGFASAGETPEEWFQNGRQRVEETRTVRANKKQAKNIILFVGDGMGISTVTAARILEGQLRGDNGEENNLSFDTFPHVALSKVYQQNQQTPDSAPTMTSMVTGVKTNEGILGLDGDAVHNDHTTAAGNTLKTILEWAEESGRATGIVSTARVTHATPAACYAKTPNRDWESDRDVSIIAPDAYAADYPDIARQLIEFPVGDGIDVVLGGGRTKFLPAETADPEDAGRFGERLDGRDLTDEFVGGAGNAQFVWNRTQFDSVNPSKVKRLLGLFERSHMEYEADRAGDTGGEPSLTDMTVKAVQILSRNKKGFFLHVESGRIDHAHHAGNAYRALTDAIELSNAVRAAYFMTDPRNTTIIVTADHGHVMTIGGYPTRGNPILGKVRGNLDGGVVNPDFDADALGLPYTTLTYANGPGYTGASNSQAEGLKTFSHFPSSYSGITAGRPDLTEVDTEAAIFMQEAAVPLSSETHSGEDVAIYATGPCAFLFQGVVEQNVIYHVMAAALRLEDDWNNP